MTSPRHQTKKDYVIEVLRAAILSGELEPGARVLQDELAERLEVSSTPVREALRQLVAEGILSYSPHKGVQVAEVNLNDVQGIYLIRGAVEALATRLAVPRLTRADIQQLQTIQANLESLVAEGELRALRKLNQEFHMLIYAAAGIPQLSQIIRNLWTQFPWDTLHVLPGRAAMSAREHRQIILDIEDGDAEAASQHMQTHIEHGVTALSEYLLQRQQASAASGAQPIKQKALP
jgi:DNA-binding GntR family transcriptional regulator